MATGASDHTASSRSERARYRSEPERRVHLVQHRRDDARRSHAPDLLDHRPRDRYRHAASLPPNGGRRSAGRRRSIRRDVLRSPVHQSHDAVRAGGRGGRVHQGSNVHRALRSGRRRGRRPGARTSAQTRGQRRSLLRRPARCGKASQGARRPSSQPWTSQSWEPRNSCTARSTRTLPQVWQAYELHLLSSSSSGALSPILLGILAKGEEPTQEHHAEVAEMLAGAKDVESADIAEGVERVIDRLLDEPARGRRSPLPIPTAALAWLCSSDAGERWRRVRTLPRSTRTPRGPGARAAPKRMGCRSGAFDRLAPVGPSRPTGTRRHGIAPSTGSSRLGNHPFIRRLLPLAHAAIRSREHTKSGLVAVTTAFKHAYRALGSQHVWRKVCCPTKTRSSS